MEDISVKQIGDYQLLSIIGDGAQGRVYKACAACDLPNGLKKGDPVALKVVNIAGEDDRLRQKFQAQADILRRLSHESIVKYIDSFTWHAGELDECQCLVMEYLEGEDLTARVRNMSSGLAWPQVEDIFEKCLAALIHARECGITHRDLKPSNIYLTRDGKVKLIDFDIARRDDSEQLSTAGWKGTFDYMAPDFITLEGFHGDEISDVFSLGVCFYQALTGKLPYEPLGSNAHIGYVNRWHSGNSKPPSYRLGVFRVLAGAKSFVSKALAVKREERYQSFSAMLEDFRRIHYRVVRHKGKEDYELLALLGRGGFGEVFKARCASDGRLVAVKHLFAAQQSDRFVKEAKILQRYNHENIVQYVDFLSQETNTGEKQFFLVMEYLEGMPGWTLRSRIKNEGRIGVEECVTLFKSYLGALDFMHGNARPIIHRDIKPGNLYAPVGRPEKAKIFDLGIARDVSGTVTVGGVPGTLDYMAPEFADASGDRGSPRSDIYALGLCLYEALTGKPVYERLPKDVNSAWTGFLGRVRNPPEINFDDPVFKDYPRLVNIIRRTLAINPDSRYAGAKELITALDLALKPMDFSGQGDDFYDETEVTMATAPGDAGMTVGTRPLQGDISEYLEQIGAAKKDSPKQGKSTLVFKLVAVALLLVVAGVGGWLGIAVLLDKGKKTIDGGVDDVPVKTLEQPAAGAEGSTQKMAQETVAETPEKVPAEVSGESPEKPMEKPPVKTAQTDDVAVKPPAVAEQPGTTSEQSPAEVVKTPEKPQDAKPVEPPPMPEPPPEPVIVAPGDFQTGREILALIAAELTDDRSVENANRAMLLLAENEKNEWKDVQPDEKLKFIDAQRKILTGKFTDLVKNSSMEVVNLSAAGKNTDTAYNRLLGFKKIAPLLIDRVSTLYQQCCEDADKAIKRRLVSDMVASMTARVGRAQKIKDVSELIEGFKKLEATPEAEIVQAQSAAFKAIARERCLTLANEQFDAYKAAVDADKTEKAVELRKEFDDFRITTSPEYGQAELDKMTAKFDDALKQAAARKEAARVRESAIVNKTHPPKETAKPPAVNVTDTAVAPVPEKPAVPVAVTPAEPVVTKPAEPVADAKSYLEISVSPSKATVQIDGREVGAGRVEVEPGTNHRVDITCPGYQPVKQFYRVEPGKTRKVDILLQKGKSRSLFGF